MRIDGIFLDMYGTLTTGDRAAVEQTCARVIADCGLAITPVELSRVWGDCFFRHLDESHDGHFRMLAELEGDSLVETMHGLRVELDPAPYVDMLSAYWRDPRLQPEATEFLADCPAPICIVSNADRADLDHALRRRGVRVAHVVTSEDARSYKPHMPIFEMALEQTGWSRERVIHVGDSLHSDVGGARSAGIRSGWLNRAHRIHDVGEHEPDHEFADLHDLNRLLRSA